ncbi:MAG: hypothetical protein IKF90_13695 [Parasporobacterium sp.]|nr:hypothetical protein [Parasporobacterium sp.]
MVSFDICEGNPGALTFLMQAYSMYMFKAEEAFQRMQDHGITGSKLYCIWNDCCKRDTDAAVNAMLEKPIDEIQEHINGENGYGIPF